MAISRYVPWFAIVAVAAAIVAGLFVSGSPGEQRARRADEQRVADLQRLSERLARHYRDARALPANLEALVDGRILTSLPHDPATGMGYEYVTTGAASYHLCADFVRESKPISADDFWAHPRGRKCFDFDYSAIRFD
jgi:type II secretory pathway pseudopilin PulG